MISLCVGLLAEPSSRRGALVIRARMRRPAFAFEEPGELSKRFQRDESFSALLTQPGHVLQGSSRTGYSTPTLASGPVHQRQTPCRLEMVAGTATCPPSHAPRFPRALGRPPACGPNAVRECNIAMAI